jgi:UDP-3-O-[3-hydroxymyristoyl] glucosamine N-acyltransferase
MPDIRFFSRAGPFPLRDIAALVGAEPLGPEADAIKIHDIGPLDSAGPHDISVFTDVRYRDALKPTRARAIIISRNLARHAADTSRLLYVKDPRLAYAQVGQLFYPLPALEPGIDPRALVDDSATIGAGTQIDANAVIGRGVEIGARCHIGCNVVVGDHVRIGDDCRIGANTSISHALIGQRVGIETGVTIGSQGFGFVPSASGLTRMLQLGRVVIEDDAQIGANCAIDRGATGDTLIGAGTVIDNLVQIAHNVRLGQNCVICAQVGIAGSTVVGDGVMIGGQVGIVDHVKVGSGARIAAMSGVMRNVEPAAVVGGIPALPIKAWHRQTIGLARLFKGGDSNGKA